MRRIILIGTVLAGCFSAMAQQRPVQSLYMFDPLLINPAYAGTQIQLSSTAIYRNQWVNLDGAPKTFTATMHSGFYKAKMGLGIIITNDQIGVHNDFSFYGVYSYKLTLPNKATLSMGIQGGFNNLQTDYNKLTLKSQSDPNLAGIISKMNPNVGAGIYYKQQSFYLGFSAPQLIDNVVFNIQSTDQSKQRRYYYLFTGFSKEISKNVSIVPSTLVRFQEQAPVSFDLNATFVFYKAVGLGASYRLEEGIVGLFELQINDNFHVGYAYDFTASPLNQFSSGSHELMINYRVKITKLHKGLACPAYW